MVQKLSQFSFSTLSTSSFLRASSGLMYTKISLSLLPFDTYATETGGLSFHSESNITPMVFAMRLCNYDEQGTTALRFPSALDPESLSL